MMQIIKKYILTSVNFQGQVSFGFNEAGYLVFYLNETDATESQLKGLLQRLPRVIEEFYRLTEVPTVKFVEVPPDLSFESWWKIQLNKINKKRCMPLFNALKDAKRMKAFTEYPAYLDFCKRNNRGVVDPENFLKKEYYENDWKKMK
jgi:hypothetical protein